jgi:hypothetical protein
MHTGTSLPDTTPAKHREIFALLCAELPPPPDNTTPDIRAAREQGAMDAVVALHPDNAFEARLAVRARHRA